MANFDQNVTIDIDVDPSGVSSGLQKAKQHVREAKTSMARMGDKLGNLQEQMDSFRNSSANAFKNIPDEVGMHDIEQEDAEKLEALTNKYQELGEAMEVVEEKKEGAAEANKHLSKRNKETEESTVGEADAISNLIRDAESLTDVKNATSKANKQLSNISKETAISLAKEHSEIQKNSKEMKAAISLIEEVWEENDKFGDSAEDSAKSTRKEAESFQEAMESAEGLADAKKAASNANKILSDDAEKTRLQALKESGALDDTGVSAKEAAKKLGLLKEEQQDLGDENEKTSKSLGLERDTVGELSEGMDGLAGAKKAAANANRKLGKDGDKTVDVLSDEFDISKKNARSILGLAESSDSASSSSRRLRKNLDRTTDSMRAANKIGGLFEDGLGSLSVNLGAFTVALRNFLTQVPILLAGLGSLGAAVLGLAGAFVTLGGAIGTAVGAGALAMAQGLEEEYSRIENTGEALQVILAGMRDMFEEALSPLTDNAATMEVFRQVIVGTAQEVSRFADTINNLMTVQDSWADGVMGIQGVVDELGDELDGPMNELMVQLSKMFKQLQDEFIEVSVGFIEAFAGMTEFTRKFADGITDVGDTIDQFFSTLKEMAQVGKSVFGGLEPVFVAFSGIMQDVAGALNSMNDEFIGNIVTFLAIGAAVNKVAGFFSGIIGIFPNFIAAVIQANGSVTSLSGSMLSFLKENNAMIGGLTSFAEALENAGDEMDIFRARAELTENSFRALDDVQAAQLRQTLANTESMEEFEEQLLDSALASNLTQDRFDALNDELDEMQLETFESKAALESLDDTNVDVDVKRDMALGTAAGGAVAGSSDEAAGALERLTKKAKGAKGAITGVFSGGILSGLSSIIGSLSTSLASIASYIPPIAALVALIGGVLVGIIGNLDSVMSGLGGTMDFLGGMTDWLVNELLDVFIAVWNSLYNAIVGVMLVINPLINSLELMGITGGTAGGVLDGLVGIIQYLLDYIIFVIDAVGTVIRLFGTLVGMTIQVANAFVAVGAAIIDGLGSAMNSVMPGFMSGMADAGQAVNGLVQAIANLPKAGQNAMDAMTQAFQDGFNEVIDEINLLIKMMNLVDGIDVETIDRVDYGVSGGEGGLVNREELSEGSDQMFQSAEGVVNNNVTLNEDNSTNIEQSIDADPEDKTQLSRVVSNAIDEANSFERRRQGGQ